VTSYQSSTRSVTGEQGRWPPFALVAKSRSEVEPAFVVPQASDIGWVAGE
jgi:hypothetical protein